MCLTVMAVIAANKTRLITLAIAVSALLAGGCASDGAKGSGSSKKSQASAATSKSGSRTRGNIADGDYYATGWVNAGASDSAEDAAMYAPMPAETAPRVRNSRGVPLGASEGDARSGGAAASNSNASAGAMSSLPEPAGLGSRSNAPGDVPPMPSTVRAGADLGYWTLVVQTFTEGDTTAAAQRMISEMKTIAPEVQNLGVHPSNNGAMVVFGRYSSREDPKAAEDKAWLKTVKYQGRPVFPRVSLTHLDLRPLQTDLHPYDLNMARREHPKVNPLYTLEVAVWDDLGSGKLPYDEIQRKAEAYVMQLRVAGYEAYFYHDDVAKRSMVTVSLFDKTAINDISGLYSDAVTALMKRFPARLVNGEPMGELIDRFRPEAGIKPQSPALVLVPDM
jgi:hypothetical protein